MSEERQEPQETAGDYRQPDGTFVYGRAYQAEQYKNSVDLRAQSHAPVVPVNPPEKPTFARLGIAPDGGLLLYPVEETTWKIKFFKRIGNYFGEHYEWLSKTATFDILPPGLPLQLGLYFTIAPNSVHVKEIEVDIEAHTVNVLCSGYQVSGSTEEERQTGILAAIAEHQAAGWEFEDMENTPDTTPGDPPVTPGDTETSGREYPGKLTAEELDNLSGAIERAARNQGGPNVISHSTPYGAIGESVPTPGMSSAHYQGAESPTPEMLAERLKETRQAVSAQAARMGVFQRTLTNPYIPGDSVEVQWIAEGPSVLPFVATVCEYAPGEEPTQVTTETRRYDIGTEVEIIGLARE